MWSCIRSKLRVKRDTNSEANTEQLKQDIGGFLEVKVVVLGDSRVGKSKLVDGFLRRGYNDEYKPTIYKYEKITLKDPRTPSSKFMVMVDLYETSGDHEQQVIHKQVFKEQNNRDDVFILAFAIDNRESFENIVTFWTKEISKHCSKGYAIVVVATKSELRSINNVRSKRALIITTRTLIYLV